jgi:uncharacterized membrane-anchored protein
MDKMKVLTLVYKGLAGGTAGYVAYRLMEDKVEDTILDGNAVNALSVGMGQMAISMTVATIVANVLG